MAEGVIIKALSGFYYIYDSGRMIACKAKGKFRHVGMSPLVGDRAEYTLTGEDTGILDKILPRKNSFIRPAVANVDALVFVACGTKPVTDPYLIDRVSVIAKNAQCETVVCINKIDINNADELYDIYTKAGFRTIRTSAVTGEGTGELLDAIKGKICAFTGNSGAGKSSLLNVLSPGLDLKTADISEHLGRGKHTTRHVEFFSVGENTLVADTPGFASFEVDMIADIQCEELQYRFIDFEKYLGECRFNDCRHLNEPDCAVLGAVKNGSIMKTRHESYVKLYDIIKNHKPWD